MAHAMPSSASLPSDYALIAHYAAARGNPEAAHAQEDEGGTVVNYSNSIETRSRALSIGRPFSVMPTDQHHPEASNESNHPEWPIGALPEDEDLALATETTPLILPSHGGSGYHKSEDWRQEWKILARYTAPVFAAHILEYSLSIAPVVSIGHISTDALAAVTLGTMTASVTGFSLIIGMSTAMDTMLPPAWTSGTPSHVGLWTIRMAVLMTLLLVPVFFIWMNAEEILLLLQQEPEIAHLAGIFLQWFSLGLPAYAFNAIVRRYFQSQGLFSAPTRILIIVAPTNALLNYLLVWGPQGIRLGFIGAPIATSISFNLISVLYIIYGLWFAPKEAWHPITRQCLHELGPLFKLGLSGMAQVAAEWWCFELIALAASQIGSLELAVQSVLLVSASTSYQAPYALSAATSVRIGNMLGAHNAKGAALATRVALFLTMAVASFMSAIFLIFRKHWAYMFNNDPDVMDEVSRILPLIALFQIFDGLGCVTGAILRAKGKQDLGAMLNLIGYYVIGLPCGFVLAFKVGLGLEGLWIGLTVALVVVALLALYICTIRTNWETEVRKTMIRLGHETAHSDSIAASTIIP